MVSDCKEKHLWNMIPSTIINRLTCFLHLVLHTDLRAAYIFWFFLLLNNTFTDMPGLFFSNWSIFLIDTGNSSPYQSYWFSEGLNRLILSERCLISSWCNASMAAHLKHSSSLFCQFIAAVLLFIHYFIQCKTTLRKFRVFNLGLDVCKRTLY